ncbi:MAG TPA: hypothetical protein VI168_15895 [Croceibacterium sp.]
MRATTGRIARLAALLAAASAAVPALGQAGASAEDQLGAVQRCRAIADLEDRVACYDRASAPGAQAEAVPPPPPPPTPEERFGRTPERARAAPPPPPPPEAQAQPVQQLDRIEAKIASLRTDALGRVSFVLDNGQTWRMTEAEAALDLPGRGDPVTIRRGAVGGYRLDWGNIGVRVARVE